MIFWQTSQLRTVVCIVNTFNLSLRLHAACRRSQSSLFPVDVILAKSVIRRTRLFTVGDHVFPVAGSRLCNSLPRKVTSAATLAVFRKRLKTYFPFIFFVFNPSAVLYTVCRDLAVNNSSVMYCDHCTQPADKNKLHHVNSMLIVYSVWSIINKTLILCGC